MALPSSDLSKLRAELPPAVADLDADLAPVRHTAERILGELERGSQGADGAS